MSLEKVVLRCFRPLSLSLTSLLSRPVSIQGSGVESPDPTRIGEGARVHLSEEASPGGRGAPRFLSRGGAIFAGLHGIGGRQALQRCGLAAARSAQLLFGWRTPGLRQDQRLQTLFCADTLCPLIPVACRGRLPVP
jgi:hypothetical protein